MRYRLMKRDGSCTFQKIMLGRRWIGRVTRHADGDWLGVTGNVMVRAATPHFAFQEVCARHAGFNSYAEMVIKIRKQQIERQTRARRADAVVKKFMSAKTLNRRARA